jgi:RNA polymerase sigma factor (TIGR02999 family)
MGGKLRQNRSRLVAGAYTAAEVSDNTGQVSRLLREWMQGDERAHDELVPIVYGTLRRLAQHYLADERHAQTLQPTALVHEAYVRLVEQGTPQWGGKAHFYGVAAHLMRQVLVDHARRRLSLKRGAGAIAVELEAALDVAASTPPMEIIALNEALEELAAIDQRKCRVIEMRYFGGLTEGETAATLGLSVATVRRDLRAAEAWLGDRLRSRA